jgi:hypothetical protein
MWNMEPNLFGNGSKAILSNSMGCTVLPSMGTLKKVYPHRIYKLVTNAMGMRSYYYVSIISYFIFEKAI